MDNIKLFAKNKAQLETQIQTIRVYNQDIGLEYGTEKCTKFILRSGKKQSRKNQNTWRKGKLHVLGNIGSGHHPTSGDQKKKKKKRKKKKEKKRVPWTNEKAFRNQTVHHKSHQRDKHLGGVRCNLFGTILKMD